jgi:hypothetical protein
VLDTDGDAVLLTLPVWLAVCVADTLAVDEGEGTK